MLWLLHDLTLPGAHQVSTGRAPFFLFFGARTMDLLDPTSTAAEIIDYYDRHPSLTLRELSSMTGRSIAYLKGLLMHPEKVKA